MTCATSDRLGVASVDRDRQDEDLTLGAHPVVRLNLTEEIAGHSGQHGGEPGRGLRGDEPSLLRLAVANLVALGRVLDGSV